MMHHHHPIPQSQMQRGDPNRIAQQTHRLLQNQQRGHPPIMLGVAGASPVPPPVFDEESIDDYLESIRRLFYDPTIPINSIDILTEFLFALLDRVPVADELWPIIFQTMQVVFDFFESKTDTIRQMNLKCDVTLLTDDFFKQMNSMTKILKKFRGIIPVPHYANALHLLYYVHSQSKVMHDDQIYDASQQATSKLIEKNLPKMYDHYTHKLLEDIYQLFNLKITDLITRLEISTKDLIFKVENYFAFNVLKDIYDIRLSHPPENETNDLLLSEMIANFSIKILKTFYRLVTELDDHFCDMILQDIYCLFEIDITETQNVHETVNCVEIDSNYEIQLFFGSVLQIFASVRCTKTSVENYEEQPVEPQCVNKDTSSVTEKTSVSDSGVDSKDNCSLIVQDIFVEDIRRLFETETVETAVHSVEMFDEQQVDTSPVTNKTSVSDSGVDFKDNCSLQAQDIFIEDISPLFETETVETAEQSVENYEEQPVEPQCMNKDTSPVTKKTSMSDSGVDFKDICSLIAQDIFIEDIRRLFETVETAVPSVEVEPQCMNKDTSPVTKKTSMPDSDDDFKDICSLIVQDIFIEDIRRLLATETVETAVPSVEVEPQCMHKDTSPVPDSDIDSKDNYSLIVQDIFIEDIRRLFELFDDPYESILEDIHQLFKISYFDITVGSIELFGEYRFVPRCTNINTPSVLIKMISWSDCINTLYQYVNSILYDILIIKDIPKLIDSNCFESESFEIVLIPEELFHVLIEDCLEDLMAENYFVLVFDEEQLQIPRCRKYGNDVGCSDDIDIAITNIYIEDIHRLFETETVETIVPCMEVFDEHRCTNIDTPPSSVNRKISEADSGVGVNEYCDLTLYDTFITDIRRLFETETVTVETTIEMFDDLSEDNPLEDTRRLFDTKPAQVCEDKCNDDILKSDSGIEFTDTLNLENSINSSGGDCEVNNDITNIDTPSPVTKNMSMFDSGVDLNETVDLVVYDIILKDIHRLFDETYGETGEKNYTFNISKDMNLSSLQSEAGSIKLDKNIEEIESSEYFLKTCSRLNPVVPEFHPRKYIPVPNGFHRIADTLMLFQTLLFHTLSDEKKWFYSRVNLINVEELNKDLIQLQNLCPDDASFNLMNVVHLFGLVKKIENGEQFDPTVLDLLYPTHDIRCLYQIFGIIKGGTYTIKFSSNVTVAQLKVLFNNENLSIYYLNSLGERQYCSLDSAPIYVDSDGFVHQITLHFTDDSGNSQTFIPIEKNIVKIDQNTQTDEYFGKLRLFNRRSHFVVDSKLGRPILGIHAEKNIDKSFPSTSFDNCVGDFAFFKRTVFTQTPKRWMHKYIKKSPPSIHLDFHRGRIRSIDRTFTKPFIDLNMNCNDAPVLDNTPSTSSINETLLQFNPSFNSTEFERYDMIDNQSYFYYERTRSPVVIDESLNVYEDMYGNLTNTASSNVYEDVPSGSAGPRHNPEQECFKELADETLQKFLSRKYSDFIIKEKEITAELSGGSRWDPNTKTGFCSCLSKVCVLERKHIIDDVLRIPAEERVFDMPSSSKENDDLYEVRTIGYITGRVIVTMPSVPLQAMTQSTVSVHQQQAQTMQQSQTPQQVLHSQQSHDMDNNQVDKQATNTLSNSTSQQNVNNNQQHNNTTLGSGASSSLPSGTSNTLNSAPTASAENSSSAPASSSLANIKEKTPMCLINELARFNKIQHQYRLTGESGPAHKKRFTVSLKLGTEEYEAEGNSIKKAQHEAAKEALLLTKLNHPPPKTSRNLRMGGKNGPGGHLTPTVELNALAMKRGEPTVYLVELNQSPYIGPPVNGYNPGYHRGNIYNQQGNRFNYDARRYNGRGHYHGHFDNQRYQGYPGYGKPHGWHGPGNPGDTFTVTLRVGPRGFTGEGPTAQAARHDAASRALQELRHLPLPDSAPTDPNVFPVNGGAENGNQSANTEDINYELKSPISLIHEIALKRNLNVAFEVQSEKGLPHMKVFVTTCHVGDLVTEGEGNGKKISKKRAAEKMLEELKKLPPLSPTHIFSMSRLKRKPAVPKKKTRSLIKVFQEQNEPDFTEEINPISRLIQIQQAKKEKEPVYNLLEERGAARRREFVMEVTVGQYSATGTGTNKKLAKRAAAEALLLQLGYDLQPGQSLEKSSGSTKATISTQQEIQEKQRKVTFLEDKAETQPQGGTSGRQLVPGLLLMGDQSNNTFSAAKSGVNIQTTATIAKEFLIAGISPTADALAKAGHNSKIMPQGGDQSQMSKTSSTQVFRPKQQLLYLSKLLNFQVQFSDFPKANHQEFLTLLSISTDPPQVCHGGGDSTDESHDEAALSALRVLSEMGLDNNIQLENKKDTQNGMESVHNQKNSAKSSILSNGIKK